MTMSKVAVSNIEINVKLLSSIPAIVVDFYLLVKHTENIPIQWTELLESQNLQILKVFLQGTSKWSTHPLIKSWTFTRSSRKLEQR